MREGAMYQVGSLLCYTDDDPVFKTIGEAEKYVVSEYKYCDFPVGIWTGQDEGSELVAIYHDQTFFRVDIEKAHRRASPVYNWDLRV